MQFTIVESKNEVPVSVFRFRPPGGTIGRSQSNDLVLPDEDRAISRLQALVHLSAEGECRLTNQGSVTPVIINGVPLERGEQRLLCAGDSLIIGDYQLRIGEEIIAPPAASEDPLALFAAEDADNDPLGILRQESLAAAAEDAAALPPVSEFRHPPRLSIDPVQDPPTRTTSTPYDEDSQLVRALLEGMGLNQMHPTVIGEAEMQMTGRMLSLFAQGTVALLSSRSILKRGVKADLTMILNEANNPFKILPSGKTALMQIYQSQMPGFMQPEHAVRDALIDLQAHQLGMIAGIRAIIAAMLQSFNPQRLEEQARSEGRLNTFSLSMARKAALWDAFMLHYQHVTGEVEDDFHTLFGEAFLHAYDMEVNQYKDSQLHADES